MSIKDIFEIKKLPSVFFLVIAVVGAFLFYGGEYVLIKADPKTTVGFYAYIIWLLSCGLLVTNVIKFILTEIRKFSLTNKFKKEYRETLQNLDAHEISVVREFFIQNRHALEFPYDHPVITGLISKEVIFITSSLGPNNFIVSGGKTTFTMNKYMRSIINPNEYFGLNKLSQEQIEQGRPHFLKKGIWDF
ncbi:superinfection exclusion B family protein [Flavobacterium sp. N2820]|uniref:superinfection exclusion B family protein n=1 Tax=Flavobacterium sp. N2820 TaxID=2986834 RepID=UPI0022254372|nr:superinfection exclusion B family protein [Flavobacterium sp. N2820]